MRFVGLLFFVVVVCLLVCSFVCFFFAKCFFFCFVSVLLYGIVVHTLYSIFAFSGAFRFCKATPGGGWRISWVFFLPWLKRCALNKPLALLVYFLGFPIQLSR